MSQRINFDEKGSNSTSIEGKTESVIDMDLTHVDTIVDKYNCEEEMLIPILQDIQAEYNYLPKDTLIQVADKLDISLIQVYRVATFFKAFSLKPKGEHHISVCLGTACHVRNAPNIKDKLERELGIKAGDTTNDLKFSLETVNCLGACALGPIVVVDGEYHGQMNTVKVDKVLKQIQSDRKGE